MLAVDLIAWTQHLLLHGTSPRPSRRRCATDCSTSPPDSPADSAGCWLRIQRTWPWARELAAAFARLATLPAPAG